MIYNRLTNTYEEDHQQCQTALNFLYNTRFGRLILKLLIQPFISKIIGFYHDTCISKLKIKNFIKKNNIDMNLYVNKDYKNFNEFFTREKKNKKIKVATEDFISPADSKLLIYKITPQQKVTIKNSTYTLSDLVDNKIDLKDYKKGYCMVFRLALDDYHRYCYVDDGTFESSYNIKGKLHTVCSISKDYKIYKENHRVISKLNTKHFDDIIYIEVGALSVGKIINHEQESFKKGDEKGYFKMGGSTIVVLVKDSVLKIDEDILKHATKEIEVKLSYGEKIGTKK